MTNKIWIVEYLSNQLFQLSADNSKILGTMSTIPRQGDVIALQNVFYKVVQIIYEVKENHDDIVVVVSKHK